MRDRERDPNANDWLLRALMSLFGWLPWASRIYILDIHVFSHPPLDHLTSYPQVFVHCTSPRFIANTFVIDKYLHLHPQNRRSRSVLDQDKRNLASRILTPTTPTFIPKAMANSFGTMATAPSSHGAKNTSNPTRPTGNGNVVKRYLPNTTPNPPARSLTTPLASNPNS